MQIIFVHQTYPAQFGHLANWLTHNRGHQCVFVSRQPPAVAGGVRKIQYRLRGGATQQNHYCSRTFENTIWHAHGVYEAMAQHPEVKPDLIVGHSGFGSTVFLKELFDTCPVINYFEYFYYPRQSDMDFRAEFPPRPIDFLRVRARNAMILLDLHYCDRGYSPTHWQRSRIPTEYQYKMEAIFDGIDTRFWNPNAAADRHIGNWEVPKDMKLVTYSARGLEAMRGFDIFMEVAKRLSQRRSDVVFAIAGKDQVFYGNDVRHTGDKTLKQTILAKGDLDLSRFHFLDFLPTEQLAKMFCLSDLHFYLTVPFVLSWSLMNALSCGCRILASNTAPVREVIKHEENGLLNDFYDVEGYVNLAMKVLDDPAKYRPLGQAGRRTVEERYSYDVCLPRIAQFFESTAAGGGPAVVSLSP